MGKNNRFREDALKYWDIKCEDAWTRFEEAVRGKGAPFWLEASI